MGDVVPFGHARASAALSRDSTIPQREAGARKPARARASCITKKVSAGNLTNPFQLKAALYLRPVNIATDGTPPSASITSAVVRSSGKVADSVMDLGLNPNFLDQQYPNFIDTKKFGVDADCPPMAAGSGTDSDTDVATRCRALTLMYADGVSSTFANNIGASPTRWNNIETTGALSRDIARMITQKYPEVSLDWLYRGLELAYGTAKAAEFREAYAEAITSKKTALKKQSAKRVNRRAG